MTEAVYVKKLRRISTGVQIGIYLIALAAALCLPSLSYGRGYIPYFAAFVSGIFWGFLYESNLLLINTLIWLVLCFVPVAVVFCTKYKRIKTTFVISAVILGTLCCFGDNVINVLPIGVLTFGFMTALYFCLTKAVEMRRQGRCLTLFWSIVIPVCLSIPLCIGVRKLLEYQHWQTYNEIVRAVSMHQLVSNEHGEIVLPRSWDWAAYYGTVYQVKQDKYGLALIFPVTIYGGGRQYIGGYIYGSTPLPADTSLSISDTSHIYEAVTVWRHEPGRPGWYYGESPDYDD